MHCLVSFLIQVALHCRWRFILRRSMVMDRRNCSRRILLLVSLTTGAQVHPKFYFFGLLSTAPLNLRNYTAPSTEARQHCCMRISFTSNLQPAPLLPVWTTAIITPSAEREKVNTSACACLTHHF